MRERNACIGRVSYFTATLRLCIYLEVAIWLRNYMPIFKKLSYDTSMAIWHLLNEPISTVEMTMSESMRRHIYKRKRQADTPESQGYFENGFISKLKDRRSIIDPDISEVSIILLPTFFLKELQFRLEGHG